MMNIYVKIAAIMQDVQYLAKDDHVEFGSTKYKALSEEKVTSIMRAELLKHKLVVYPHRTDSRENWEHYPRGCHLPHGQRGKPGGIHRDCILRRWRRHTRQGQRQGHDLCV